MAQAARLSIRMQKELKLLLTDPPPGASFPFLSSDSGISSLSTIDAQIEGPEGTVYSKGIFHIKIQIPERYPFQPPNVTFVTPIYHPNIDNGGRICLDILNLPPKGAWQPSLNISTVMTSIGLLLSEPNPDDGLMCEVSREYKYNRCIFDQKARTMTEKYAKAGACGYSWENQSVQTNADLSTSVDGKQSDKESKHVVLPSNSKPCGISRKLSLAPSKSTHKEGIDREANEQLDFINMGAKIDREKLSHISDNHNLSFEKVRGSDTTRNSSLESSVQFHKRVDHDMKDQDPEHSYLHCSGVSLPVGSKELPLHKHGNAQQVHLHQDSELAFDNKSTTSNKPFLVSQNMLYESSDSCQTSEGNNEKMLKPPAVLSCEYQSNSSPGTFAACSSANQYQQQNFQYSLDALPDGAVNSECKKTCPVRKKLSLGFRGLPEGHRKEEKENVLLINQLPHLNPKSQMKTLIIRNQSLDDKLLLHSVKLHTEETQNQKHNQNQTGILTEGIQLRREEIPVSESVIVLDSEDSEEESDGAIRTKLSIVRNRMGKRKTKA